MTADIVHIRSYTRRKPRSEKPDPILMDILATDLAVKFASEPLDGLDMDEADKQRIRETGF